MRNCYATRVRHSAAPGGLPGHRVSDLFRRGAAGISPQEESMFDLLIRCLVTADVSLDHIAG